MNDNFGEIRYWSDTHKCDCLRLSHVCRDGIERWVIIEMNVDQDERQRRRKAAKDLLKSPQMKHSPAGELNVIFAK